MTKKDKLVQFNRGNILETAKSLFLKNGLENTSMDEIAKSADCSKSTLYVYFKNKDDIYYTIVYEYMKMMRDAIHECICQTEDIEECYYTICKVLTDFEQKQPMYFSFILRKISINEMDYEQLPILYDIYTMGEETNSLILAFLEKAVACGFASKKIALLPTVFVLWSGICSVISLSSAKEEYFQMRLGMNREEFLHYGFEMLLTTIRKEM